VLEGVRELLADVRDKVLVCRTADAAAAAAGEAPPRVLAYPAHNEADQVTVEMLRALLDGDRCVVEVVGEEALTTEVAEQAEEEGAGLIFIGSVSPRGLPRCRYLCKRLRGRFPIRKIVVGRWGSDRDEEQQLREDGADDVVTTLAEARLSVHGLLPVVEQVQARVGCPAARR
jgi:hypothetical protein